MSSLFLILPLFVSLPLPHRPLVWLGLTIMRRFDVCATLSCTESTLYNWLTLIESHYRPNPYHNSTHAADVMQATAYFLDSAPLRVLFDPLDCAAALVAAIIHDVNHPGRNSAFLCNSSHELAILYNDVYVFIIIISLPLPLAPFH